VHAAAERDRADQGFGRPKRERVVATRMSQASASSKPPPTATPSTAAISGLLRS